MKPSSGRPCDPDTVRAKADLRELLPDNVTLADELAMLVLDSHGLMLERLALETAGVEKLRTTALQLRGALEGLEYNRFLEVHSLFNAESIGIFRGFRVPRELAKNPRLREQLDALEDEGKDYLGKFVAQLRFLEKVGRKRIGRPKQDIRLQVAVLAAKEFRLAGIKPATSSSGEFARALRILFECAGLFVPDNMFPIVQQAVRQVSDLLKYDPEFAAAVSKAAPAERSRGSRAARSRRR